jgi:hypothetical protein
VSERYCSPVSACERTSDLEKSWIFLFECE